MTPNGTNTLLFKYAILISIYIPNLYHMNVIKITNDTFLFTKHLMYEL
jgi:hypothetical protein